MKKNFYKSNWLSNISVALVIVGGFQHDMPTSQRVFALVIAAIAYLLGRYYAKGDD